jgi:tetratricopeptide (TPR) repeat protein
MYYDIVKSIENFQKTISLHRGPVLPNYFRLLSSVYRYAGFKEEAILYGQEALKYDNDSAQYYMILGLSEYELSGNLEKAIELLKKGYAIDSTEFEVLIELGPKLMIQGKYEEALKYYKKLEKNSRGKNTRGHLYGLGYVYWQLGYTDEADNCFNEGLNHSNSVIERKGAFALNHNYHLAKFYAFKGEKNKAYENLRIFNQRQMFLSFNVADIKNNPMLNSLRGEPEFQEIVADVEEKYRAEHKRVSQWLEDQGKLQ